MVEVVAAEDVGPSVRPGDMFAGASASAAESSAVAQD